MKDSIRPLPHKVKQASSSEKEVPIFDSYTKALEACGSCDHDIDYRIWYQQTFALCNQIDALEKELDLFEINRTNDDYVYALYALQAALNNNGPSKVVDFGGACGHYYFIMRHLLGKKRDLRWTVVEKKGIVAYGMRLANTELTFADDLKTVIENTRDIDLILASGVIQYLPNPYRALDLMVKSQARFIFLNRMSLTLGDRDVFSVQKYRLSQIPFAVKLPDDVPDIEFRVPHTNIQKRRLDAMMSRGYDKVFEVENASGLAFVPNRGIIGRGALYQRRGIDSQMTHIDISLWSGDCSKCAIR